MTQNCDNNSIFYIKECNLGKILTSDVTPIKICLNVDFENNLFKPMIINKLDKHDIHTVGDYYNISDMLGIPFLCKNSAWI